MSGDMGAPAKWWLGPPAPRAFTLATRVLQATVFILMAVWVLFFLGGLRFTPRPVADGGNDTSQLFNWHPLLLTLAFPMLMAEAILAFRAPLIEMQDRQESKYYHFGVHTAALGCTILGVVAAFNSHTLKRPTPVPNLYSSHSFLGMAVLSLLVLQYLLGAASYLYPKLSVARRRALAPIHMFLGKAIFVAGIATMAVGIQEKQTFVQAFAKPASVYAAVMRIPAVLQLLLLLTAMAVLYHHVPPAAAPAQWRQHYGPQHEDEEGEAALVSPERSDADTALPGYGSHSA